MLRVATWEPFMIRRTLLAAAIVAGIATMFIALLYQPWLTQWGSTVAERGQPMRGDNVVTDARTWTRSITINAPPEQVWPWLVQIGVDKGGFYTYD
jgi:hypothetical protein